MAGVTMYGIRNCNTVKKARTWLDAAGVACDFHDYKIDGIDRARLEAWTDALGWETVLNRAGTTFRKLAEADRRDLDRERAIVLMLAQPSIIKRPLLDTDGTFTAGFRPATYEGLFAR